MTSQNGQTKVAEGRELGSFLILATAIAAFALMFVGTLATLSDHLTASIETVLARCGAPAQSDSDSGGKAIVVGDLNGDGARPGRGQTVTSTMGSPGAR